MHPCMHILCRHVYICMCVYYIVRPLRSHTGSCVLLRKAACRLFSPQGNKSGWHWVWRKVSKRLQQRSACRCVGCTKLCKDGPWPSFPKRKSVHARFYGSALARNALPPTVPNWPSWAHRCCWKWSFVKPLLIGRFVSCSWGVWAMQWCWITIYII